MYQYTCELCGKTREAKYKSGIKRFCSHKCANIHRWNLEEKKQTEIICLVCGKAFVVKNCDPRFKDGAIKYCSRKCAGEGSRKGRIEKCKQCGKEFYTTRNEFCGQRCAYEYRSVNAAKKVYSENGYLVAHRRGYNKRGNAKLHRLIMEEHLGRRLGVDEVVHHVNGIKTDNRIENLRVMSRAEHSKLHRQEEREKGCNSV